MFRVPRLPRLKNYIDEDAPFGLSDFKQTVAVGCCGCTFLAFFIFMLVMLGSLYHLGPDQQVIEWRGRTKADAVAYNGPGKFQLNPGASHLQRDMLRLSRSEYAYARNWKTNEYTYIKGPTVEFLDAPIEIIRQDQMARLMQGEYARTISRRNGVEVIWTGPTSFIPPANTFLMTSKAPMLTKDQAILYRDRQTGDMHLATTCSETPGPFFPSNTRDIIESRSKIHVAPFEALVMRTSSGGTQVLSGASPPSDLEGFCANETDEGQAAGGFAFFLPAFSRILRMKWSNYSTPPSNAANLTTTAAGAVSSTRRRRTTKNRVVLDHTFSNPPDNWLVAGDYDRIGDFWMNRGTGQNLSKIIKRGSVQVTSVAANSPAAQLTSIVGAESAEIDFGGLLSRSGWTICSISRYTGVGSKRSVIAGDSNWAHGHYRGFAGVAYYAYAATDVFYDRIRPDTEWVPICGTSAFSSAPNNVFVRDDAVGIQATRATSTPSRVHINGNAANSSGFALAEIITWNRILLVDEIKEAMEYLNARLRDASTYVDQVESEQTQALVETSRRDVTQIDLRSQKSFYKYQVRTNDNVRLVVEGTVLWQILDPAQMLATTSDPEGDVWQKARSIVMSAVSSVSLPDFLGSFNDVIHDAFEDTSNDTFWQERGLRCNSLELTGFEPMDTRTIATLRTNLETRVDSITQRIKIRSENDVRDIRLAAEIAFEDNRTALIEVKASNSRLEAETIGATEGSRRARSIAAFVDAMRSLFPDNYEGMVELYEHYLTLRLMEQQAEKLFNGRAKVFLKPKGVNVSLQASTMRSADTTTMPPASGRLLASTLAASEVGVVPLMLPPPPSATEPPTSPWSALNYGRSAYGGGELDDSYYEEL